MIFDIFFTFILLFSIVLGIRSGFLAAVFHTCGWLAAVICGFVFNSEIQEFLHEHTHIYDAVKERVSLKFDETISDILFIQNDFSKPFESAVTAATDAAYSIICFVLTVIAVMLILYILLHIFSKKYTDGLIGFADGALGGLIGAVRGVILLLLISLFLFPAISLISPLSADAAAAALESSHFASYIYENNPLGEILSNI